MRVRFHLRILSVFEDKFHNTSEVQFFWNTLYRGIQHAVVKTFISEQIKIKINGVIHSLR